MKEFYFKILFDFLGFRGPAPLVRLNASDSPVQMSHNHPAVRSSITPDRPAVNLTVASCSPVHFSTFHHSSAVCSPFQHFAVRSSLHHHSPGRTPDVLHPAVRPHCQPSSAVHCADHYYRDGRSPSQQLVARPSNQTTSAVYAAVHHQHPARLPYNSSSAVRVAAHHYGARRPQPSTAVHPRPSSATAVRSNSFPHQHEQQRRSHILQLVPFCESCRSVVKSAFAVSHGSCQLCWCCCGCCGVHL